MAHSLMRWCSYRTVIRSCPMLMAAARLDIPCIVISGPMLAIAHDGRQLDLTHVFEAVGAHKAGA